MMPEQSSAGPPHEPQPGDLICAGKYRLVRQLGAGSYGVVWLAEEIKSRNTQVAIKIARANEDAAARFDREITLSRQVEHPNLVHAETVEQDGDSLLLVLPYMPGGSLQQRLSGKKPLPVAEALSTAAQVAAGLAYLHEQDIIHRDLHPGNILFSRKNEPKISDLGLAQSAQFSGSTWYGQKTGQHPGNIFYHPPEASAAGEAPLLPLMPSADVYMLGAVLWEMLTGRLYYHNRKKHTPPSHLNPAVPAWVDELVLSMLADSDNDRPQDGEAAARLLNEALGRLRREYQQRLDGIADQARRAIRQEQWETAEQHIVALEKEGKEGQTLANEMHQALEYARIDSSKNLEQTAKIEEHKQTAVQAIKDKNWSQADAAISWLKSQGKPGVEIAEKLNSQLYRSRRRYPSKAQYNLAATEQSHSLSTLNPAKRKTLLLRVGLGLVLSLSIFALIIWSAYNEEVRNSQSTYNSLINPSTTRTIALPSQTSIIINTSTSLPATSTSTRLPTIATPTILRPPPTPSPSIGSTMISLVDGMVLAYIPAGEFLMGSPEGDGSSDENPQHAVHLDAYWMDLTEVTNYQYSLCVSAGQCNLPTGLDGSFRNSSYTRSEYYNNPTYANYPIIHADWGVANNYCAWAGRRLPTEAEWEMAARGQDGNRYPWGNQVDCSLANYRDCVGDTTEVGSYIGGASPYGVLDMAGNVWEWVADFYDPDYYSISPFDNPLGPASGGHSLRGGSWREEFYDVLSANRWVPHNYWTDDKGIRCAMTP